MDILTTLFHYRRLYDYADRATQSKERLVTGKSTEKASIDNKDRDHSSPFQYSVVVYAIYVISIISFLF